MFRAGAGIFYLSLFLLVGCQQEFEDISLDKEYAHLIDAEYVSLKNLKLHGVTMDKNYRKQVDHYSLTSLPGFDGPEVVSVETLEPGTVIKIKKVQSCNNCFMSSPIVVIVDIVDKELNHDAPIRLYGLREKSNAVEHVNLDQKFFKRL